MKNILSKWNITPEELNQATDELCAKGIAKGCYQNTSALLALVLIPVAGGGAAYYFVVMKPKQAQKVPSNLDDLDLEDEEEYLNDEETEDSI